MLAKIWWYWAGFHFLGEIQSRWVVGHFMIFTGHAVRHHPRFVEWSKEFYGGKGFFNPLASFIAFLVPTISVCTHFPDIVEYVVPRIANFLWYAVWQMKFDVRRPLRHWKTYGWCEDEVDEKV